MASKGCRALTEEEIKKIFTHSFPQDEKYHFALRDRALCQLSLSTGYRVKEILSLKLCNVYSKGHVFTYVSIPASQMKGGRKGRNMPIPKIAQEALLTWIQSANPPLQPGDSLWRNERAEKKGSSEGIKTRQANLIYKAVWERAGIPDDGALSSHTWRKTFARRMAKKCKGNIKELMMLMGQTSVRTTELYYPCDQSKLEGYAMSENFDDD